MLVQLILKVQKRFNNSLALLDEVRTGIGLFDCCSILTFCSK